MVRENDAGMLEEASTLSVGGRLGRVCGALGYHSMYYCRAFDSAVLEPVRIRRWSGWSWVGRTSASLGERERLLE